jgi:putative transposase|tara:strand:+ start:594 stop:1877 length:1284 start_codon:yes stop_codon:yes gene_type:complete
MILTKKIQINPNKTALKKLWKVSSLCTNVWNACLEQRKDRKSFGKINCYSQKKELTTLKKEFPEFKIPSSQTLQNVVFGLDRCYQSFFTKWRKGDKKVRPPRFKASKYFFTQEYSQRKTSFEITDNAVLRLAFGKNKKTWIDVKVPELGYETVKTVKIMQDACSKKWYACMTYFVKEKERKTDGPSIYFDPGCKTSLTGIKTTGQFCEYDFNYLRQINASSYAFIDKLTSRRDKKKSRISYSYRRLKRRIKKTYRKINTRTNMYLHALANKILNDHPDVKSFQIGDWDKRQTLADTGHTFVNRRINRAVQNNNPLGKLIEILSYKAKIRGQEVKKFNERGTTRTCSQCNHRHKDGIKPGVRTFKCQKCDFTYSRDHQSCLNFLKKFEPALWQRLPEIFSGRSVRVTLRPFLLKPYRIAYQIGPILTS